MRITTLAALSSCLTVFAAVAPAQAEFSLWGQFGKDPTFVVTRFDLKLSPSPGDAARIPLSIVKAIDASSPKILEALGMKRAFAHLLLVMRKDRRPYLRITLSDVRVRSIHPYGTFRHLTEKVELSAAALHYRYEARGATPQEVRFGAAPKPEAANPPPSEAPARPTP